MFISRMPKPVQYFLLVINDAIRAVPMLVLLFLVYYFPVNTIFGIKAFGPTFSAILALGISQLAYTADIVRSAVLNVSEKTINGAKALGLKDSQIFRYIITPDVLRQILPAEIAFFIGIIRLSSLAGIIGCQELVFVARSATVDNFRSAEAWILVGCIYVLLVVPLTIFLRYFENTKWIKRRW